MPSRPELELASIGARLRDAGLTARTLAAWAGTGRIAALPVRLAGRLAGRLAEMPERPPTPTAAILALCVAGDEVPRDRLQRLPAPAVVDELIAHELVEANGDRLRARVAIVPLGQGLLVCDRLDAPVERDRVSWPDDSSHHLAIAIPPGRRADWLDLGCGSAFAALARPELATRISGVDVNERAVRYARLGAGLSGISHFEAAPGDVGTAREPAELVTCNAPIPDPDAAPGPPSRDHVPAGHTPAEDPPAEDTPAAAHGPPAPPAGAAPAEVWRHAGPGFFDRLWPALARAVRPGGMIVVHGAGEAVLPALAGAGGERVIVTYTPAEVRGFAVAWWRPDAPERHVVMRRALTPDRPHIDPHAREEALAR